MMIYDSPDEKDHTCHMCGKNKANAFWNGEQQFFVCRNCAVEKLPELIADAVVDGINEHSVTRPTNRVTRIETIEANFHSAFSSALVRKYLPSKEES